MSANADLLFPTAIDLAGLDRDIVTAESMVGSFADSAASKLANLKAPSLKLDAGSMGDPAAGLSAKFLPVGGLIAGAVVAGTKAIQGAIGQIEGSVKQMAKVISKQLHDAFTFAQAQDGIRTTKDLYEHDLTVMRRDFDAFAKTTGASSTTLFKKMKAQIQDAEHQFGKFLQHSKANLVKGKTLPSFDTLFTNKSKTYDGGGGKKGKGGTASGGAAASGSSKAIAAGMGSASASLLGVTAKAGALVAVLALVAKAFAAVADGVKHASDLNETLSKTNVIFGDATEGVTTFADKLATKFGLVKGVTLDTQASMGGLAKSVGGLKGGTLAGFANTYTKLAADLSSFSNIDMSAAAGAIQTGLAGNQSDTLRELGVVYDEDAIKAKALKLGIAKVGEELDTQQEFTARAALILGGLAKVSGDLERTQFGAANQARQLAGTIENLGTSIGGVFLPVVTEAIILLNELGTWATKTFEGMKSTVDGWKESFLTAFDWVIATIHNLPAAFEVMRLSVWQSLINIVEIFGVLGPNFDLITSYIGRNWALLLGDLARLVLSFVQNAIHNIGELGRAFASWLAGDGFSPDFKSFTEGFVAAAEKFPDLIKPTLTDLSKEMGDAMKPITDEVAGRQAKRAVGTPAFKALDVDPEKSKKKDKEKHTKQLGGVLELGSKEAYSSIANALSAGSSKKDADRAAKDTAGNTAELVRLQRNADKRAARMQQPGKLAFPK